MTSATAIASNGTEENFYITESSTNKTVDEFQSAIELYDAEGNLRLVPIPSTDPNDPLRLPEWRKWAIILTVSLFAAGGMTMANSIGTLIPTFLEYYSQDGTAPVSTAKVTELATYPSLFMGVGAIISVILAQWIGTRPVLILDAIITLCFTIWAIFTDDSQHGLSQHIAARAMASLGVGAVESLVPVILKDTNYLHTRNMRLSFVWSVGGIFNAALASSSTYIIEGRDWRVFYWILVGIMAAALVLIIFIVPESSWQRTHEDYVGISRTDADGFAVPIKPSRRAESYWYSLRLISEQCSAKGAWKSIQDLSICLLFPNIIWSVCLNAAFIGATISANNVIGTLLITGWHWEPQNVGLLMVPLAIASLVVIPVAGLGGDFVIKLLARRNNGLHTPEHQLVTLVFPVVVGFIGTLCFGIVCQHPESYHWIVAFLMITFQFVGLLSVNIITATYAVECFPDVAEVMLIAVGAYKNIVGFGLTDSTSGFVESAGYLGCFGTYAAIQGVLGLLGIPLYLYGQSFRSRMELWAIRRRLGTRKLD
ncbi:hypothetical protein G7054_g542 [Neopestalotiopsis clavispora]|nr:hypothetical protein G7054_g542 [Neopestalotiopsis clavispora]